uniref:Uncharacterized protein n=1 Tax=Dulem virus 38 TaxID=3145756 RepID=A0AAU8B1H5_9CAUD
MLRQASHILDSDAGHPSAGSKVLLNGGQNYLCQSVCMC